MFASTELLPQRVVQRPGGVRPEWEEYAYWFRQFVSDPLPLTTKQLSRLSAVRTTRLDLLVYVQHYVSIVVPGVTLAFGFGSLTCTFRTTYGQNGRTFSGR